MNAKSTVLVVPETIEEIIAKFDLQTTAFTLHDMQAELSSARQKLETLTPEQSLGAWSEVLAFTLVENSGEKVWGTFFGPLATGTNGDGTPFVAPDIAEANGDIVAHWKFRAESVVHPLLKSRYADLVWDLTQKISGERADHHFARMAIAAYLGCASEKVLAEALFQFRAIFRAYTLASQVRDNDSVLAAKAAVMRLHSETMASEKPLWWMAFDFFSARQARAVRVEIEEVVRDLEKIVAKHGEPDGYFDIHTVEGAGKRLIAFYNRANKYDDAKRINSLVAQSQEHHAASGNAMLAYIFLQKAIDAYKAAGMQSDAERVRILMQQKIREARGEMRQITHEITIPKLEMDAFVAGIVDDDPGVTFVRLACQFLSSRKEIDEQLKKMAEEAPLASIVGQSTLAEDHVSAVIGSTGDDLLGRAISQAAQNFSFSSVWLRQSLSKAIERHDWVPEHFAAWTNRLELFDETTCLVHGFSAWYEGDLVKAIHVLVPQVELGLRRIVERLGKAITKGDPMRPGVSVAIGMGDILYNPGIAELLGPDLTLHFLALCADSRGVNLRNRVAHGLLKSDEINIGITLWLIQSLLTFGIWDQIAAKRR